MPHPYRFAVKNWATAIGLNISSSDNPQKKGYNGQYQKYVNDVAGVPGKFTE